MSRISLRPSVLDWALQRSGRTHDDLLTRFPFLDKWRTGERQPTLRQLEELAHATLTPLGYFFLDEPPEEALPVPFYRTLGSGQPSSPSAELVQTIQSMQLRQAWAREYLVSEGHEPLRFIHFADSNESPVGVAARLRRVMGLDDGWAARVPSWEAALRFLEQSMERNGIMVVVNGVVGNNTHRPLNPSEFRGFVLVDDVAPLVFVNGADAKAAQMFTLAHELAHLAVGQSAAFDLRDLQPAEEPGEDACNRIAAEFLVPKAEALRLWNNAVNAPDPFRYLASRFKVSRIVAARRALDLNLISKERFFSFLSEQEDRATSDTDNSGGDFWNTQGVRLGTRFGGLVATAVREGKLGYAEAFRLTGLYGRTFDRFLALFGFKEES